MGKVTSVYRSGEEEGRRDANTTGKQVLRRGRTESKCPELGTVQQHPAPCPRKVSRVTRSNQHTCHQDSIQVEFVAHCLCGRDIRDSTLIVTQF